MVQVFSAMNSESNVVLAYIDALSKVMETALSTDGEFIMDIDDSYAY